MAARAWVVGLVLYLGVQLAMCQPPPDVIKGQMVKIAAIGPWQLDPTANFMSQYRFLNFSCWCINNQTKILPNVSIELEFADTGTVPGTAIMVSVQQINNSIIAFLGGARTPQQQVVAYLADAFKIPHVGGIVTGAILSDKTQYPYFMRTSLADQFICRVMMKFILHTGWSNVVLVHQDDAYGTGNRAAFMALATQYNVSVYTQQVNTGQTDFTSTVNLVQSTGIKVIVILCQINEAGALMRAIKSDARMVNQDYVYLIGQVYFFGWYGTALNATVFDGSIAFASSAQTTEASTELWNKWVAADPVLWPGPRSNPPSTFWFLVEGLYTLALGLQEYMERFPTRDVSQGVDGTDYYNIMRNLNYTGPSGATQFDENGDRLALCTIYNLRQPDVATTSSLSVAVNPAMLYSPFDDSFTTYSPIVYYGGRTDTPRDVACPCVHGTCIGSSSQCNCAVDYGGVTCDVFVGGKKDEDSSKLIIAIVIPIVFALGGLVAAFFIYKRKRALIVKEIADKQRSDIPRSSIKLVKRIGRGASGEVYQALFRGTEVAVKRLSAKNLSQSALQQFQLETAIMTGLRHPNIILFMGSCYDKSNEEFLLVMEYMSRGSLFDVLYNKTISLQLELQLHLAYQIVQGINFLHQSSPPIIHCDIKSHNVLLDEKWNCRICDFGITIFSSANQKKTGDEALGTVYWTAPEVLQGGNHTMQSDCYSVGILLWEIFHRQLPFGGRDPLVVAMEVVNVGARPVLGSNVPPQMLELMTSCWNQDPSKRPSIQDIVYTLRDLAMSKPMYNYSSDNSIGAPTGSVIFVSTDVADSSKLWDVAPKDMQQVMKQHNTTIRALLETYKGYEVSFKGHSFLLSFARVSDAINFCAAVQSAFLKAAWPPSILQIPSAKLELGDNGQPIWNGLRVKMVIHKGVPQCIQDKISQKMNYEGPVVKAVKRLKDKGFGGVILITESAYDSIDNSKLEHEMYTKKHGNEEDGSTYLMVDKNLEERLQAGGRGGSVTMYDEDSLPYTVVDIAGDSTPGTKMKERVKEKWLIEYERLTLREQIGLGSGAEVHSAMFEGSEVAVKLLINQNFSEENNFTLRYIASTLYKITHPNILTFIGMGLEPPHICLVTELMSTSLVKLYSSNAQFPYNEKVRIAKGIAAGMQYLCECDDRTLGNNLRLNSNNVLLGKNGEVKISDFAISKLYDSNRTLTSVNAVAWTAPEMLGGEDDVTPAVAVYSFGIVLWEMHTRKRPYATIHPIRLLNMVAKGHRPDVPSDCPPAYASLMQDCWAGNPEARPTWDVIIRRLNAL